MPSGRQTTPSSVRSMSRQAGADRAAAGRRGGAAESASASGTRGAKGHDRVYPLAQSSLTRVGSTSPPERRAAQIAARINARNSGLTGTRPDGSRLTLLSSLSARNRDRRRADPVGYPLGQRKSGASAGA